jgi:hypothetical protein
LKERGIKGVRWMGKKEAIMDIESTEKGKVGELYVFGKLIEKGAMPFLPIADTRGVDAVVRKKDGTYVEIQVKATWPPEQAGYFNIRNLAERDSLFIVGIIYAKPLGVVDEKPEVWVIPSKEFVKHATLREKGTVHLLSLGLGDTKLEKSRRAKLVNYCEAWHLLTG